MSLSLVLCEEQELLYHFGSITATNKSAVLLHSDTELEGNCSVAHEGGNSTI